MAKSIPMKNPNTKSKNKNKRKNKREELKENTKIQEASAASPYLHDDIILQILNNIPFKTLVRFCSVSKHWLLLIADPSNPHSIYSSRISDPTFLGFFPLDWDPVALDNTPKLPLLPDSYLPLVEDGSLTIDASSNGYLLCHNPYNLDTDLRFNYFVLNPFSQQRVDLPTRPEPLHSYNSIGFECHVNPTDSPLISAKFIVVVANLTSTRLHTQLEVFFSDRFQWIKLEIPRSIGSSHGRSYLDKLKSRPDLVHLGVCYWFYFPRIHSYCTVIAFDRRLSRTWTVHCSQTPLVTDGDKILCANHDDIFYGAFDRCYNVVNVYRRKDYSKDYFDGFHLWEMEYSVSFLELKVKYPDLLSDVNFEYDQGIINFHGFYPCNPRIFVFILGGKLISYDVDNERLILHLDRGKHLRVFNWRYYVSGSWISYEWWSWPRSLPNKGTSEKVMTVEDEGEERPRTGKTLKNWKRRQRKKRAKHKA